MKLNIAQYILLLPFIILIISTIKKYLSKKIMLIQLFVLIFGWLIVATIIIFPNLTQYAANLVGIGRGADLVIYISLILIFSMLLMLISRSVDLERKMTQIVRIMALKDVKEPNNIQSDEPTSNNITK